MEGLIRLDSSNLIMLFSFSSILHAHVHFLISCFFSFLISHRYSNIFPAPEVRVAVHNASVKVRLHSGVDWHHADVVDLVERQAECIELVLDRFGVCFEVYGTTTVHSARLSMVARDVRIVDHVAKSLMNVFLSCVNNEAHPRETDENMARFGELVGGVGGEGIDGELFLFFAF